MAEARITHVTIENFDKEVIKAPQPVVIDFWAPWCGPCRAVAPVLEELADQFEGQVRVAKVNVDEQPELAGAFRIRGIPTLVAMVDGEVAAQMVGFGGKARLVALFSELADKAGKEEKRAASAKG